MLEVGMVQRGRDQPGHGGRKNAGILLANSER
jgi:hypothetical protein